MHVPARTSTRTRLRARIISVLIAATAVMGVLASSAAAEGSTSNQDEVFQVPSLAPASGPDATTEQCAYSGAVCLADFQNLLGEALVILEGPTGGWKKIPSGFNDRAESFESTKPNDVRLAQNADGSGEHHCVPHMSRQNTMGTFNNKASAYWVYNNPNVCQ
jgi:hypothetical protein